MRTKTLILGAALCAAGMVMTAAQTFSVNVVGYVNVTIPAGFSMIANPLNNTEGNTLDNLLPNMAIGDTVFKFSQAGGFEPSTYIASWTPNFTLEPGEGVFIQVGQETNLTFVGEVMQGTLSVELPAGLSIASNMVPAEESLDNTNFPAEIGDTIFFFRNGTYEPSTYIASFTPEAVPAVGEAFWVQKSTAGTWTREFTVPE
jgi:hypothetical protein